MTKRLVALGLTVLACGPAAAQPAPTTPAPASHPATDLSSKLINGSSTSGPM